MAGQIILINGTSGSGKSTTCEQFVRDADDFWLHYGVDHFFASTFPRRFGHHGDRAAEGFSAVPLDPEQPDAALRWQFSKQGLNAMSVFHEWIAAASRQGCNIIVDHLLMCDPPLLQDCVQRLAGLPVLLVNLQPPYEVLAERVASREIGSRFTNSSYSEQQKSLSRQRLDRLRPWFYRAIYQNTRYDLNIDTSSCPPEEVCQQIRQRLQQDSGRAFKELLQQHNPG